MFWHAAIVSIVLPCRRDRLPLWCGPNWAVPVCMTNFLNTTSCDSRTLQSHRVTPTKSFLTHQLLLSDFIHTSFLYWIKKGNQIKCVYDKVWFIGFQCVPQRAEQKRNHWGDKQWQKNSIKANIYWVLKDLLTTSAKKKENGVMIYITKPNVKYKFRYAFCAF